MQGLKKSPLRYYGGKTLILKKLLMLLPERRQGYVEVFGGGAVLLFAKPPEKFEVYNDIDSDLVNFFRVLRDEEKSRKFAEKLQYAIYSREEFKYAKESFDKVEDEVDRALMFYVVIKMSINGRVGSGWSYALKGKSEGRSQLEFDVDRVRERLRKVQIENLDYRELIDKYDREGLLFYMDPPYVHSTRVSVDAYRYEMSEREHVELVERLLRMKGIVMLSGYRNEIYEELERNGWKRFDFEVVCWSSKSKEGKKGRRIESVWVNPQYWKYKKRDLFLSKILAGGVKNE